MNLRFEGLISELKKTVFSISMEFNRHKCVQIPPGWGGEVGLVVAAVRDYMDKSHRPNIGTGTHTHMHSYTH